MRKTIIVSFYTKIIVLINHFSFSITKNFFFESNNNLNIVMYVHIIDVFIFVVIVRNNKSVSIKIFKNFRLNRISEIDFLNANVRDLTFKQFKTFYKNDWFKKFISICVIAYAVVVAINNVIVVIDNNFAFTNFLTIFFVIVMFFFANTFSSNLKKFFAINVRKFFANKIKIKNFSLNLSISIKIIMSNKIIIYNSKTTNFFVKIVENFFIFWHNIDFVKMLKKN